MISLPSFGFSLPESGSPPSLAHPHPPPTHLLLTPITLCCVCLLGKASCAAFLPHCCHGGSSTTLAVLTSLHGISRQVIDAVNLEGSFEYPPGRVSSKAGKVVYMPTPGVHVTGQRNDSFLVTVGDCLDKSTPFELHVAPVAPPQEAAFTTFRPPQVKGRSDPEQRALFLRDEAYWVRECNSQLCLGESEHTYRYS